MLGDVDDLTHVVGVVRQLPVDRLQDAQGLPPDGHRPSDIGVA